MDSGWLLREGEVLASAEITSTWRDRLMGLLGRQQSDVVLVLKGVRSVHTMGMRFSIDIAFCDKQLNVIDIVEHMKPWRIGRPRFSSRVVVEAQAGSFGRWQLKPGDKLEIKE